MGLTASKNVLSSLLGAGEKSSGSSSPPLSDAARLLPNSLSLRLPAYMPVWKHRSVCRAWHRAVLVSFFWQSFTSKEDGLVTSTEMLSVSRGLFEGHLEFVARRLELAKPQDHEVEAIRSVFDPAGREQLLLAGPAEVKLLRGGDEVEEVALAFGTYALEMLPAEKPRVVVRTMRRVGIGKGNREDFELTASHALFRRS
mmetsp:Transcript_90840/g.198982  ORF Transcript_90840/g.198982 Transcript_90840/m.198982 type:complete len:199 (+) Transcript_90840:212-808(+)|eukprot:CAMPEP_0206604340 /NCGR_PEP_ID=MMETSP0325_2-20121206/49250_1 /ASSEMBLY_ACC=CAM_ASM_000347 /TAXON_ID=2866 /ORGANISM="Crypthecodinium cohnii, Strain Seligo" /LENGTH=198 /DNA_ID=CAMNT_0054118651 /DNA_START=146 /DNA_END=742 /DNA_ORIENTATION=-